MESEKMKEIKKALKCCIKLNNTKYTDRERQLACINCPYANKDECDVIISKNCLTLINELEEENEQLLEENESLNGSWKMQLKKIAELENEIEENAFYSKGYAQGIKNTYEVVVPDKLKQFAERLKEKIENCSGCYIPNCFESPTNEFAYSAIEVSNAIDETLKDFINQDKSYTEVR